MIKGDDLIAPQLNTVLVPGCERAARWACATREKNGMDYFYGLVISDLVIEMQPNKASPYQEQLIRAPERGTVA